MLSVVVLNELVSWLVIRKHTKKNRKREIPLGGGEVTKPLILRSYERVILSEIFYTFNHTERVLASTSSHHQPLPRHVIDTGLPQKVHVQAGFSGRAQEAQAQEKKDVNIHKVYRQERQLCHPRRR